MKLTNRKSFVLYFSILSSIFMFLYVSHFAYPHFIKTETRKTIQANQFHLKLSLQIPRTRVHHPFPYERVESPRAIQPDDTTTSLPRVEMDDYIPIQTERLPRLEVVPNSGMKHLQEIKKRDIYQQRELKPLP